MKKVLNEWFITAPWGKIALVSWGSEKGGKVLLVHGRQDSAATFLPLLELLPDEYHYVALDLPGHGYSDPFPIGLALTRFHFVSAVDVVVKHLNWKKFTYLAHSMGGEIGLFFNAARPNLVKKFIFLDIGVSIHAIIAKPDKEYFESYTSYYDNYDLYNVDDRVYTMSRALEAVRHARGVGPDLARLVLSRNLRPLAYKPPPSAVDQPDDTQPYALSWDKRLKNLVGLNLPFEQLVALFTSSAPPTLLVAASTSAANYEGSAADRLLQEMRRHNEHFHYKVVEGGHDLHLTDPDKIAESVARFLAAKFPKAKL